MARGAVASHADADGDDQGSVIDDREGISRFGGCGFAADERAEHLGGTFDCDPHEQFDDLGTGNSSSSGFTCCSLTRVWSLATASAKAKIPGEWCDSVPAGRATHRLAAGSLSEGAPDLFLELWRERR